MSDILADIDEAIESRSILEHPFYQRWSEGHLDPETLAEYSRQYYHLVARFPGFLRTIQTNCQDAQTRDLLQKNLDEEEGPPAHSELWLRFCDGLGVTRESVLNTEFSPGTRGMIDTLSEISENSPTAEAIAAIYAYESQNPEVARTKMEGLRRFYGVHDERSLEFFTVHQDLDVEHSDTLGSLIERLAPNAVGNDALLDTANRSTEALWNMLDEYETP